MNVLVIGASRGIGREFARQYLDDGARVTATARRDADVADLAAQGAHAFALDVADAASAAGLAWRVDGAGFDVAIVNAGVYGPRTTGLQTPSEADFDHVMHTNVLGPMRVIPQLDDALALGGKLVVVSSRMGAIGRRVSRSGWLYRASKAALNSVMKDTALTWAQRAVCVAVHPGWVRTDMGGPEADLDVHESVANLRGLIAGLTGADHGRFFNHDGTPIDW